MTGIRAATVADLPGVAAVYNVEVETGVSTFETRPAGPDHFRPLLESTHPGDHLLVAVEGGRVLGYASSQAYRPRPGYDPTREVSVYLARDARGRGLGGALYAVLLPLLDGAGVHAAVAVVALPNPRSVALHVAFGFEHVGTLRQVGRKFGRLIDTALYQRFRGSRHGAHLLDERRPPPGIRS